MADTLEEAIREAYRLADGVQFANAYRRSDIGQRALAAPTRPDTWTYQDCPEFREANRLIQEYYLRGEYVPCFQGHMKLAVQGYSLAECQVGYFYWKGLGVERDLGKALYWMERAARHGDPDAPENLAEIRMALLQRSAADGIESERV